MILLYLALVFLLIFFFIVFVSVVASQFLAIFTTHAPFVPVPKKVVAEIVKSLDLKDESVLYDLGCGDGRVLLKSAELNPKIKAVGIEIAFLPYFLAKFHTRQYKNIKIKRENIFKTDMSSATHIFLYLYPEVINKLIHSIKSQCKPGTIIVSCDFELENITPKKVVNLENLYPHSLRGKKLFIYII